MILTSSAPARPPRRSRLPRRTAMAVIAALLTTLAVPLAAIAAPSPDPSPTPLTGEVALTLAPVGQGVVRPGTTLSASAILANGTAAEVPATTVTLEIGARPLPDDDALTAWLAGEGSAPLEEIGSARLEATASGAESVSGILVAPDDPGLAGREPGVYPLQATADLAGGAVTATSVIVVPDDTVSAPVGLLVPITAPPRTTGLAGATALAELTAIDGTLTAQLDAVEGTDAILAIDPALPAAIRVLGTAAPDTAVEWLARLEALPNARFALQYGDADLATQVAAGVAEPLQPTSLAAYITPADLPSSPAPTATPPAGDDAGAAALPDLATLTSIGANTQQGFSWPATGTAGGAVVAALAGTDAGGAPTLSLLPDTGARDAAGSVPSRARATADAAQVLLYDGETSAALRRAADQNDTARRAGELTAAVAHLTFAVRDAGGQPLLVTVDRGSDRERVALRTALSAVAAAPGVVPASLGDLLAAEPIAVRVDDAEAEAARAADLTQLLADEEQIAAFATILDDPTLLTGRQRAEILQLLAVAWRGEDAGYAAALADHRAQTRETLDAVGILPTSTLNLISYDATFAPWIRNDLPWPAHVTLVAQPGDPRLIVGERTEVVASAASNTRAAIPVQARIGNGAVTVTMQLYSPTGVAIGAVSSAEVEVRAEWETIGLVILIALMVLFVGLGVFRTIRRRRTRRLAREDLEPEVRSDRAPEDAS